MLAPVLQVLQFALLIAAAVAVLEGWLHYHFTRWEKSWFLPAGVLGTVTLVMAGAAASAGGLVDPGRMLSLGMGTAAAECLVALFFKHVVRGRHSLPIMLLAPAALGLGLLIAYPLVFEVYLAFHDLKLTTIMAWSRTGELPFVGLKHFKKVFTSSPLSEVSFWQLFLRTVWWTFINVFFHVAGGFVMALLLNSVTRGKGLYRMLLIVPWAMPQVVAVLAMRGEFHSQYGFVNVMLAKLAAWLPFLGDLGVGPVQWLGQHPFLTCTIINVWLGIPFMAVVILGGLQSISRHYYDAASLDGASAFQQFRMITLPLIRPVLAPAVTLGTVWTFNNINVIYLVTGQAGGTEDADILVSALYKAAFAFYRYSYSAAFALIVFLILFTFSMVWLKWSKGTESHYD
ncbi:MAG: sugar ABC transporter permease [Elusimicrobiota bacterium]|jgi:arabinogalactan oligomer/maltooligosaccharide transport system permease protein